MKGTALTENQQKFQRKFNVGLTLQTDIKEFRNFLDGYGQYIHSFFFSPPLGSNFQTRKRIARQFSFSKKEKLFWEMLELIKKYDIKLELLFNTVNLTEEDIKKTKQTFDEHQIDVDYVCFIEKYYEYVDKYFHGKEFIWSYNNERLTAEKFEQTVTERNFNVYVLGSYLIRDNDFFRKVKENKKEVILLLNNACSFQCATCAKGKELCKKVFQNNHKEYSVEYLYALQSVLPNELFDGTIDTRYIDYYKISNRSMRLSYAKGVIDSYTSNKVKKYIKFNKNHYAYWGHLLHFWPYFWFFNLKKIKKYKEQILGHEIDIR